MRWAGGHDYRRIKRSKDREAHPLQQAFINHTAFQCGFCTPGILMSAKALLRGNPSPAEEEVKEALSGNFCRCISHYQVVKAIMAASGKGSDQDGRKIPIHRQGDAPEGCC